MSEIVFLTFKNQMKKLKHVMWSKKDKMIGAAHNGRLSIPPGGDQEEKSHCQFPYGNINKKETFPIWRSRFSDSAYCHIHISRLE